MNRLAVVVGDSCPPEHRTGLGETECILARLAVGIQLVALARLSHMKSIDVAVEAEFGVVAGDSLAVRRLGETV